MEYYVLKGLMLDSEHPTLKQAVVRANAIMEKNGDNHPEVKIGNRDLNKPNDILLVFYRGVMYVREELES